MRALYTRFKFVPLLLLAAALTACGTQVNRMDVGEVKDLSGAWNDTDSQLVSAEMIRDVLSRQWLNDFVQGQKRRPAVIVGEVRNLSHEHINVNTFVGDMERELINSDRVEFVASSTERQEVREERKDQDVNASRSHTQGNGPGEGRRLHAQGHHQYHHRHLRQRRKCATIRWI